MVLGVSQGFAKNLTLIGVGYRAQSSGKNLTISLGYSHPIEFPAPEGIELKVEKNTTIMVSGANKELVGLTAAKIRGLRPPEPYHGKGVRYENEVIQTKVGKAAGKK
jgi:large subunit ribosomal protein L6